MDKQIIDPILKKYRDLILANTKIFKAVYTGDPIRIPASNLPALILSKKNTKTSTFTNVEDIHDIMIVATIVTDIRKEIKDEKTLVPGYKQLYDIMEGRDPDSYQLLPTSLMYILRHNVNIDQQHQIWTDIKTMTGIDYGQTKDKREEGSWALEAAITFTSSIVQIR